MMKLDKILNKQNKILFYVPDTQGQILVSVYEIYFQAKLLKDKGYNVFILTDNNEYVIPEWIDSEVTDIEHLKPNDLEKNDFKVSVEDFIISPEFFVNFWEQVKQTPAKKLIMFNSIDAFQRRHKSPQGSLIFDLKEYFDISGIIFNSKFTEKFFKDNYRHLADIPSYIVTPTIPKYFEKTDNNIKPLKIGLYGRNTLDMNKVVELFFCRYPAYKFISFEPVQGSFKKLKTNRVEFAESLKEFPIVLTCDDIGTFNTFNLECFLAETMPVGVIGNYKIDYLDDGSDNFKGFWKPSLTNDLQEDGRYHDVVEALNDAITYFIDDELNPALYESVKNVGKKYIDSEDKRTEVLKTYETIFDDRIKELNILNDDK